MGNIFFTSDTHFGHKRIIELAHRPYESVQDMDAAIIEQWNKQVSDADTVYILGDFSFYNAGKTAEIAEALNGEIRLVKGNHDYDRCRKSRISWIRDYYELDVDGRKLVLFHFPIEEWNQKQRGSLHLHGHLHSGQGRVGSMNGCRIDVGWDAWHSMVELELILNNAPTAEEAMQSWQHADYHR